MYCLHVTTMCFLEKLLLPSKEATHVKSHVSSSLVDVDLLIKVVLVQLSSDLVSCGFFFLSPYQRRFST